MPQLAALLAKLGHNCVKAGINLRIEPVNPCSVGRKQCHRDRQQRNPRADYPLDYLAA